MEREGILVVNFGGQYAHLISDRVRRHRVYSKVVSPEDLKDNLKNAKGIIFSGGPRSVYQEGAPLVDPSVFDLGIPELGICYGWQAMAYQLGGKVTGGKSREYSKAALRILSKADLFQGMKDVEQVWLSHGDSVEEIPSGFVVIGSTERDKNSAAMHPDKKLYGLQFHPEVTHTINGMKILANLVYNICGCKQNWSMKEYFSELVESIRKSCKDERIFVQVSGGVDSTTLAILLSKIFDPSNVTAIHFDALLRKYETRQLIRSLRKVGVEDVIVEHAEKEFLNSRVEITSEDDPRYSRFQKETDSLKDFHLVNDRYVSKPLKHVVHPEVQRWIIGKAFAELTLREIEKLGESFGSYKLFVGTLYPDWIESAKERHADTIKTHHNLSVEFQRLRDANILREPFKELYKDEVRQIAQMLGLPDEIVWRHPFPGPGIAVRIINSRGPTYPANHEGLISQANEISMPHGLTAFVEPWRTSGVQGDERTYSNPVGLFGESDWKNLEKVSIELANKLRQFNAVDYVLHPREVEKISIKPATLTRKRMELEREADYRVMKIVRKHDLMRELYQFPVVLVPMGLDDRKETVLLRPIKSEEAMTAEAAFLDRRIVDEMTRELLRIEGIGSVLYRVSHKPPTTIESG